jgi:hypothetical protein
MLGRAMSPMPISPTRQRAVSILRREGVEPTAGEVSGRKSLRYSESTVGDAPFSGGKASAAQERVAEQFTQAVLRRVGENATRATPDVIDRAFTRIGNQFETVGVGSQVKLDPQFGRDVRNVVNEYASLTAPSQQAPIVGQFVQNFNDVAKSQGGIMDGTVYNAWRSQLSALERKAKADPRLSEVIGGMREALDDAFERSASVAGRKDLVDDIREARRQYRNLLVVDRAAGAAGENAAAGLLSPAQMRMGVTGQNRRDYTRGRGEFADLVRSANEVLTPLPNSGTAQRLNAISAGLPAMFAGGGAMASGASPETSAAAALAAAAGPGMFGRLLMSPVMQAYLKNQVMASPLAALNPSRNAQLQAILNSPRLLLEGQQPR